MALLGSVFAAEIIGLLFGDDYAQSMRVFSVLVWLVPLYFMRFVYGSALFAAGFQRSHNVAMFAGLVGMTVIAIPLISGSGPMGGAVAAVAAEVVLLGAMMLMVRISFRKEAAGL